MTNAIFTRTTESHETYYQGDFTESVESLRFGQAGVLKPLTWTLKVHETVARKDDGTPYTERTSFELHIIAKNPHTSFTGKFSYPYPSKIADYDYGYGAAGYIVDVHRSILAGISEATGVDFSEALQTIAGA